MADLQLLGATRDWHLWHTLRRSSDGSWTEFGDVEEPTGGIGNVLEVACAGSSDELHVCAASSTRLVFGDFPLWHAVRGGDGSWTQFGDVEGQAGEIGFPRRLGAAAIGGELHVCALTSYSQLWHTIRHADGSWEPFGDLLAAVGGWPMGAGAWEVDCASVAGELHVCAPGARLWHAIRDGDGTWTALGDVEADAGERGRLIAAGCAGIGDELHVCAVAEDDWRLWHTIRRADGTWLPFRDVEAETGETANFRSVALAAVDGELHVGATSLEHGHIAHAIRHADGTWTAFGDVEEPGGERGAFDRVALGGTG